MALVSAGFEFTVVLEDNGGNTAAKVYDLTSADMTEALADAAAIIPLLDAVTDATIRSYRVSQKFIEDAFVPPVAGVQVENLASIVLRVSGDPTKKVTHMIPAPNQGIFSGISGKAANEVDPTDVALNDYLSIFLTGQRATLSDGENISLPLFAGKRIHRGSRKG